MDANENASFINQVSLRELQGRSETGKRNRVPVKISVTEETMKILETFVEFGKGKFGSSFIELSIRVLCVLLSNGENIPVIGSELLRSSNSPYLTNNLKSLAKFIEERD